MRRLENLSEKDRRIHELQSRRILHCPATDEQQRSQTTRIQVVDFRKINYQDAQTIELLDLAPECIEGASAHQAPRAAYDGHILQAFDLILEFHTFNHTNQPWKKFLNLALPNRRGNGPKVTFCGSACSELTYSRHNCYRIVNFE